MSDGGQGASAKPLYHLFVEQAMKLNPRYLSMITPARWYAGGKGLDSYRNQMLKQKQMRCLVDYANSADCFPGVNIAGGVCYFLWDRDYTGDCEVINMKDGEITSEMTRSLDEYEYFVRDNIALSIIKKVMRNAEPLSKYVYARNYFNIPTTITGEQKSTNAIPVLTSKGNIYISKYKVSDKEDILDKNKVIITYAMSGGNKPSSDGNYQIISSLKCLRPGEACSETYLILQAFDSKEYADNMILYASTKIFRFLLLQALTSIHITKDKFCFVPVQDLSKSWTDEELYAKYGLTDEEIAFIESMIKPMELDE